MTGRSLCFTPYIDGIQTQYCEVIHNDLILACILSPDPSAIAFLGVQLGKLNFVALLASFVPELPEG